MPSRSPSPADSACAVVAGEAGLGKTRLVRELLKGAPDVDVLVGGCVEVGSDVLPYAPFVDILSDLADRDGAAAVRALGGPTGSELARLLPDADDAGAPDVTQASASRLYTALRALLTSLAARRPLLVLVEDVHWSDRATRDLLGLLARRLPATDAPRAHRAHRRVRRRARRAPLPRPACRRPGRTASSCGRSPGTNRPSS